MIHQASKGDGLLTISVSQTAEATLFDLVGRLNIESSPELRTQLLTTLRSELSQVVVVDLAGLTYADLSGIATLIEALKVARGQGSTLRLKGLHGRLLDALQVTGVLALFEPNGDPNAKSQSKVV